MQKKRILAFLLAAIMVLTMLPVLASMAAPGAGDSASVLAEIKAATSSTLSWSGTGTAPGAYSSNIPALSNKGYSYLIVEIAINEKLVNGNNLRLDTGTYTEIPNSTMTGLAAGNAYYFSLPMNKTGENGFNIAGWFVSGSLAVVDAYMSNTQRPDGSKVVSEPPPVPVGLAVTGTGPASVSLSWTASTDATSYNIYRNGSKVGSASGTTYTDDGLNSNTTYSYQVSAVNSDSMESEKCAAVNGTTGAPDTQPPTNPTNLTVVNTAAFSVTLNWTASTDNDRVAGYDVYANGTKVATATSIPFVCGGLQPDTPYSFYVVAFDPSGNRSGNSNTVSATTLEQPPEYDDNIPVPGGAPPAYFYSPAPDSSLKVRPMTAGTANIDNPLKGLLKWMYNSNQDLDAVGTASLTWRYFGLGDVMTGPNSFEWDKVDDILEGVASNGYQVAMRFVTANGGTLQASKDRPDFLDPYVKGVAHDAAQILDYNNEIVVSAFERFIKAFGERYNGDPRIGFIHMGLIGCWGEWHTWSMNNTDWGPGDLMANKATCERVIQAYDDAFPDTRLELRYPIVGLHKEKYLDNPGDGYAYTGGHQLMQDLGRVGYHDDSFCFREDEGIPGQPYQIKSMTLPKSLGGKYDGFVQRMIESGQENRWLTASIGGETRPEVQGSFLSIPAAGTKDNSIEGIEVAHATWMMMEQANTASLSAEGASVIQRMGYTLAAKNAYFNDTVGSSMKVGLSIENTGVAPFYYPWKVIVAVRNGSNIVKQFETDWDIRRVKPVSIRALPDWGLSGNPQYITIADPYYFETMLDLSGVANGTYTVSVRVKNPLEDLPADKYRTGWKPYGDNKPAKKFTFANAEMDKASGWLNLGSFTKANVPDPITTTRASTTTTTTTTTTTRPTTTTSTTTVVGLTTTRPVTTEPGGHPTYVVMRLDNLYAAVNGAKVRVNDNEPLTPIMNDGGRTMVPFRFIATCFGAAVDWDEGAGSAIIDYKGKHIVLPIGTDFCYVDGLKTPINNPAQIMTAGRTFVPFRVVSELLGDIYLDYDPGTTTIVASGSPIEGQYDLQYYVSKFNTICG